MMVNEKVAAGDFVRIAYTARQGSTGAVVDTTDGAVAKEAKIYDEKYAYGPAHVVVGKGMVVKGLDEALAGMAVGEEKKLELQPENAFGPRNPKLVRVLPLAEFRKRDLNPAPGMVMELDGNPALIRSVTSGRVMVDMNHSLAGEKISYDVKIAEKLSTTDSKIAALLESNGLKGAGVKVTEGALELSFPNSIEKDARYFVGKTAAVRAIKELIPEVKKIEVKEEYLA